ncbi:DNA-binding transcriptional LysR family regulator [Chitinivorax tropicus]|uniref:DNA-binding transcriptional LysR family regulator n=1 Tax=Chitinivorax tropicus TaxID=714531 RepID=A0A840MH99_9PROT|nr:LysR family transcriptional regulator [Chitinivorax tropicus]MBB5018028.1 DNA-binding transcriptional LysR family regulator [Chitinivorax tropicus]
MNLPDLNLLIALNALLAEGSVAKAAKRLHLSPSAMSRALARLRETLGDPLLVRAGRGMVPTPRALVIREQVGQLVQGAEMVLRPASRLDLTQLKRTFAIRASDGFAETFGPALLEHLGQAAPQVRLRFMQKPNKDSTPLRDGIIDLEIGVVGESEAPELRVQKLFKDQFVAVVQPRHALAQDVITPERYAAARHIVVSRRGFEKSRIDDALLGLGLQRQVETIVDSFATALALARRTNLVATVPARHTAGLQDGLVVLALPISLPDLTISMLWHPRLDADLAHRWLRQCLRVVCGEPPGEAVSGAS